MEEEQEILEAVNFIKENSPKLHLYVAGKLLEKCERGSLRLKCIEARRVLGSIFHVSKQCQLKILKELEMYKLILRVNRKDYLIPITQDDYQLLFDKPLEGIK